MRPLALDKETIHGKGFDLFNNLCYNNQDEFGKIKVGVKQLNNATIDVGPLQGTTVGRAYANKGFILNALANNDLTEIRNISNFYYNLNGIYKTVCNYAAFMYRYDWYLTPEMYSEN